MNCGENVLKFDFGWVIVRPSSKSSGFDKNTNSLKGDTKQGGHGNEKDS